MTYYLGFNFGRATGGWVNYLTDKGKPNKKQKGVLTHSSNMLIGLEVTCSRC